MASLKALKIRIGSVKSTQKITKALNMVAASKLRRAQQSAVAARPYSIRMTDVVSSLAAKISPSRAFCWSDHRAESARSQLRAEATSRLSGRFSRRSRLASSRHARSSDRA